MVQLVNPLENAINLLQDFGFFSVVLPFLLVYALVYGLLAKTAMFSSGPASSSSDSVNQVVALAIGAFVITSTDVVNSMLGIIPQAAFLLVVVLLLMMVAGLVGVTSTGLFSDDGKLTKYTGPIFAAVILVFLMIIDAGVEGGIPIIHQLNELLIGSQPFILQGEALSTILGLTFVLGIPIAVIWWMGKKP